LTTSSPLRARRKTTSPTTSKPRRFYFFDHLNRFAAQSRAQAFEPGSGEKIVEALGIDGPALRESHALLPFVERDICASAATFPGDRIEVQQSIDDLAPLQSPLHDLVHIAKLHPRVQDILRHHMDEGTGLAKTVTSAGRDMVPFTGIATLAEVHGDGKLRRPRGLDELRGDLQRSTGDTARASADEYSGNDLLATVESSFAVPLQGLDRSDHTAGPWRRRRGRFLGRRLDLT